MTLEKLKALSEKITPEDYEPFSDEWRTAVMRMTKADIVTCWQTGAKHSIGKISELEETVAQKAKENLQWQKDYSDLQNRNIELVAKIEALTKEVEHQKGLATFFEENLLKENARSEALTKQCERFRQMATECLNDWGTYKTENLLNPKP